MKEASIPVLIEFAPGSQIQRSEAEPLGNTWVVLKTGQKIELPTDQLVLNDEKGGRARIGLGGMSFEGMEDGKFVLWRVRDLLPEELISTETGDKLTLESTFISSIQVQGTQVYPRGTEASV